MQAALDSEVLRRALLEVECVMLELDLLQKVVPSPWEAATLDLQ